MAKDPQTLPSHLTDAQVHVVISTLSGTQKASTYYKDTLSPFLNQHSSTLKFTLHTTESVDSVTKLTETIFLPQAQHGIHQTIILLSGDGGVVDIVNALAFPTKSDDYIPPALVLIPMGTANALAHSSGVATDPIATMIKGQRHPLPLFHARFSPGSRLVTNEGQDRETIPEDTIYGAVVFSWGLHASLVAVSDTVEMRKHGIERFKIAAQRLMTENHTYSGVVKKLSTGRDDAKEEWSKVVYVDENTDIDRDQHSYILATLVSNLEEHFRISPATKPLDRSWRLVAIRPVEAQELMRLLGLAYQGGKHVEEEGVVYGEITGLRIEMGEKEGKWRCVCIDGKIVEVEEGGWVEVRGRKDKGERVVVDLIC